MHKFNRQESIQQMHEDIAALTEEMRKPFTPWVVVYPFVLGVVATFALFALCSFFLRFI